MDIKTVQNSYARWAPVYDNTFGAVTDVGRRRTVSYINGAPGTVLLTADDLFARMADMAEEDAAAVTMQ